MLRPPGAQDLTRAVDRARETDRFVSVEESTGADELAIP